MSVLAGQVWSSLYKGKAGTDALGARSEKAEWQFAGLIGKCCLLELLLAFATCCLLFAVHELARLCTLPCTIEQEFGLLTTDEEDSFIESSTTSQTNAPF